MMGPKEEKGYYTEGQNGHIFVIEMEDISFNLHVNIYNVPQCPSLPCSFLLVPTNS